MKKILLMLSLTFVRCIINPGLRAAQERLGQTIQAVVRLKSDRVFSMLANWSLLTWINRALSLHPGYAVALHVRCIVHYMMELLKEACRDWEQACKNNSEWCQGLEFGKGRGDCP